MAAPIGRKWQCFCIKGVVWVPSVQGIAHACLSTPEVTSLKLGEAVRYSKYAQNFCENLAFLWQQTMTNYPLVNI